MKAHLGIAVAALLISAPTILFAQQNTTPKVAMANNNLTFDTKPNDRARLREIFGNEHAAQKVSHVRFSLEPGTVVPGSIRPVPIPQTIVNIQPTWQGGKYFKVGQNEVVIVDPRSKKIEGVLTL